MYAVVNVAILLCFLIQIVPVVASLRAKETTNALKLQVGAKQEFQEALPTVVQLAHAFMAATHYT